MKEPSKDETLSEEEIEVLIEEVMATFDDADVTIKDPFISPVNSPDELLKGLPLINIIVSLSVYCIMHANESLQ